MVFYYAHRTPKEKMGNLPDNTVRTPSRLIMDNIIDGTLCRYDCSLRKLSNIGPKRNMKQDRSKTRNFTV